MKQTKLILTFAGVGALIALGVGWYFHRVIDVGLWALWFAAFDALIIQYAVANVVINGQVSRGNAAPPVG